MRIPSFCLFTVLLALAASSVTAQAVPNAISYQGKLTDSTGQIVPDGDYQIQFKLYSEASGGTAFWTSTKKTVRTSGGVFTTEIEPITPADIAGHEDIWLEIVVGDPGVALSPRIKLYSTPFSIRAGDLVLPYSGSASSANAVLSVTNSGTGPAAQFSVSNPANSSPALTISTSGTGPAAKFLGIAEMTGFKLTTMPGTGKVLTSDAEGVGTWQEPITYSAGEGLSLSENIFSVAPQGITESMLANGAVTAEKLADNSITSQKIQDGSILLADLGSNGASAGEVLKFDGTAWTPAHDNDTTYTAGEGINLANNTISVAPQGITESMLANGSVTAEKLADNSITSQKIQDGSILLADLGSNGASAGEVLKFDGTAWTPAHDNDTTYTAGDGLTLTGTSFSIASAAITSTMLANDSVDSSKIADGTIQLNDLSQSGASAGEVIKWNGTAWAPAADESGGTYTAGAGLILNENQFSIAPGGVTDTMLADNSVTSAKILDGTISPADIQVPMGITGTVDAENGLVTASNSGTGYAIKGIGTTGSAIVGYSESGTAGIFDQGASNTNPALHVISRNNENKVAIKAEGDIRVVYPGASDGATNRANPIAYAYINSNGTKASGTPNISCELNDDAQRYDITITKYDGTIENYDGTNYVAIVTPVTAGGTTPNIAVTGAANGKLFVEIWSILNFKVQGAFQIVIYKP
ncbi:MAG: hypothetical protein QHH26_05255 [Armatimonadota bacterium]|nr:hypothetical protein [Armatimonadota bacterium]